MKKFILPLFVLFFINVKAQESIVIKSVFLNSDDSVLVFKPRGYDRNNIYPAVILLHGHSGDYKSWSKLADLQGLADKYNFLIICPDGLKKSWYIDSPQPDSTQYESFFMKEFLPYAQRNYSIDAKKLFITGASMGGHGAMWLFLRHPKLFLSAGSTSGVLDLRYSGFRKTTLSYLLGPYSDDNKLFDEYSVRAHLKNIVGMNKHIIFDSGTEDYLYITSKKFREECDALKIKATYIAQPGGHTGGYWSQSILKHFEFFNQLIQAEN